MDISASFLTFIKSGLLTGLIFLSPSINNLVLAASNNDSCAFSSGTPYKSNVPSVTLHNGVKMPLVAAGTCFRDCSKSDTNPTSSIPSNPNFFGFLPEQTYHSLSKAIDLGYNHIDTALVYRSQKAIGSVLAHKMMMSEIVREDIFITTKLFHGSMEGLTRQGSTLDLDSMTPVEVTKAIESQFEVILEELGVGYVDCMLLHWPANMDSKSEGNPARRLAAWKVLEDMYQRGWARSIGVSNFNEDHLEELMSTGASILPMVNQIEASVYKQWNQIHDYCQKKGIALMAFSPLGLGNKSLLSDPILIDIAQKLNISASQVALRFLIQKGYAVLPLSSSEERLKSNLDLFSFELTEEDMGRLAELSNLKDEGIGLPSPYDMR